MTNLESQVERARHDLFLARKLEEITDTFNDKVGEAAKRLDMLQAELDEVNKWESETLNRFAEYHKPTYHPKNDPLLTPQGDTMLVNGRWVDSAGGFNQ